MKMKWLSNLLLPRMQREAASRDHDFAVIRGVDKELYLRRWWLIPRNNYFNIYLHNMLKDDDAVLHDHPYWSLSLVLTDGLYENYIARPDKLWQRLTAASILKEVHTPYAKIELFAAHRDIPAGALIFRGAHFAHQLVAKKPAWTIFVTGPRIKSWGFWCPRGYRNWEKYVAKAQDPSAKHRGESMVGEGCGEQS